MFNSLKYMLQGFLFLAILIAMILAAYFALKFINKKMSVSSNNSMEIVSGLALSQNKGIYIVRILETYYVVGLGDEVRLLTEITNQQEIEMLQEIKDLKSVSFNIKGEDFSEILKGKINKFQKGLEERT